MPRSHMHFRQVSHLQDVYAATISWVASCKKISVNRKGRRNGTKVGMLTGHLSQLTERRLVYWGLGGETELLKNVPLPRPRIPSGMLHLSLDCARCIRVAENSKSENPSYRWDRVPLPFREWLELRGKNSSHFLQSGTAQDKVSVQALEQWKVLFCPQEEHPRENAEQLLVYPPPGLQTQGGTSAEGAFECGGSVACPFWRTDPSRAEDGRSVQQPGEARQPQSTGETGPPHILNLGNAPYDRGGRSSGSSFDGPAAHPREDTGGTPAEGSQLAGPASSCEGMNKSLDSLLQVVRFVENCVGQLERRMTHVLDECAALRRQ